MTQTLVTNRLTLRRPAAQDAEATTAFYMSERSNMAGGHVPRPAAWRHFASTLGHWEVRGYGLWAVTRRGEDAIIGLVGPYFPDGWPETELGWLMFDGSEGAGYAFEAAEAARIHCYDTLGWTTAVSYIAPGNTRSIALAERLGCTLDETAIEPKPGTLVYRHPAPSEIAV
ncbi:GNAT family N-acetyltransferase [Fontisubflavum oceani]|uniref:GNAT family N-acetyltransferase n=1 Tax=Fontisubflavum oceani TaxID=2978973 RepID=UPI0025B314EA|nr:GNAT family N-acetyltransferase [Fontisubflavum oceani]WJY22004.1 GNAT family N-acetyltransferase [Fontisubflavum oceani]